VSNANLEEAVSLVLEANRVLSEESLKGTSVIRGDHAGHGCMKRIDHRTAKKTSTIPRHREINEFLARKICRDLEVAEP
jgi:hypothetical protein